MAYEGWESELEVSNAQESPVDNDLDGEHQVAFSISGGDADESNESEDFYSDFELERELEGDGISPEEEGFSLGYLRALD